jgi:hypothetical protein
MGRNWNARVVLPFRSVSLIGVRETILESLGRLARGPEGRSNGRLRTDVVREGRARASRFLSW